MLEKLHDGWEVEEKTCIMDQKLNLKVTLWMKNREKSLQSGWKTKDEKMKKKWNDKFFHSKTSKTFKALQLPWMLLDLWKCGQRLQGKCDLNFLFIWKLCSWSFFSPRQLEFNLTIEMKSSCPKKASQDPPFLRWFYEMNPLKFVHYGGRGHLRKKMAIETN
jgi:hypothetical protein